MSSLAGILNMILDFLLQILTLTVNFFIAILGAVLSFAQSLVHIVR